MDFAALKTELSDRGFAYLSDARRGQYINWARAELDAMFAWPYRLTFATGPDSGATIISDLDQVKAAYLETTPNTQLELVDRWWLLDRYGDLATTGTPSFAYVTEGSSTAVAPFPVGAGDVNLHVLYYRVPTDLSVSTDTPLAPPRYHGLYVDLAVEQAYRDSDNHAAAESLRVAIERKLGTMVKDLLIDGTTPKIRTGRGHW